MRIAMALAAALLTVSPGMALAADASPPAPNSVAAYSADTPLATLVADPVAKAVIDKTLPNLAKHPAFEQFKAMSLRQLQPYASGAISDEAVSKIDGELKALPARP